MQLSASRRLTEASKRIDSSRLRAITGSITFSSKLPSEPANATAASLPITWATTWWTASGTTGFTFPGMIDEPGCRSGRWISASPQRGPLDIQRRSLAILFRLTATTRHMPLASTRASRAPWASKWSRASVSGRPRSVAILAITPRAKPFGALMPVPTAVPPRGSSPTRGSVASMRSMPCSICEA